MDPLSGCTGENHTAHTLADGPENVMPFYPTITAVFRRIVVDLCENATSVLVDAVDDVQRVSFASYASPEAEDAARHAVVNLESSGDDVDGTGSRD